MDRKLILENYAILRTRHFQSIYKIFFMLRSIHKCRKKLHES
jgi:hypothetical protein